MLQVHFKIKLCKLMITKRVLRVQSAATGSPTPHVVSPRVLLEVADPQGRSRHDSSGTASQVTRGAVREQVSGQAGLVVQMRDRRGMTAVSGRHRPLPDAPVGHAPCPLGLANPGARQPAFSLIQPLTLTAHFDLTGPAAS